MISKFPKSGAGLVINGLAYPLSKHVLSGMIDQVPGDFKLLPGQLSNKKTLVVYGHPVCLGYIGDKILPT